MYIALHLFQLDAGCVGLYSCLRGTARYDDVCLLVRFNGQKVVANTSCVFRVVLGTLTLSGDGITV